MKDLMLEGRKIQQTFRKIMNENVEDDYALEVQNTYADMATPTTINTFKFSDARKQNIGGASNDWYAKTKLGKQLVVTFEPFWEGESKFAVEIFYDGNEDLRDIAKKFDKNIQSKNDVQMDAKMALDYIKGVLTSPEIRNILQTK
jgi:hypothetical protein